MRKGIWSRVAGLFSAAGHEPSDHTSEDTIRRELREEAGIVPYQLATFLVEEVFDTDGSPCRSRSSPRSVKATRPDWF